MDCEQVLRFIGKLVMDNERDLELIKRAQDGDGRAFDELITIHKPRLYSMALRNLNGHRQDAEDALQNLFIYAWESLHKFVPRNKGTVIGWLSRMVKGKCIDIVRHSCSLASPVYGLEVREDQGVGLTLTDRSDLNLEKDEIQEYVEMEILKLIRCLPPGMQEVAFLRLYLDCSPSEIVEKLNISKNTVYAQLSYARKRLRKDLVSFSNKEIFEDFLNELV